MKKTLILCLTIFFSFHNLCSRTCKLFYSTTVKNGTDNVLKNQVVSIKLSILKDSYSGDPVYVETQQAKTNEDGYVHLVIGQGAIELGNYSSVDLSKGVYWLQTEIAPTGTNYLTPVVQEMSENNFEYGDVDHSFYKFIKDLFNSWLVRGLLIFILGLYLIIKFELYNLFASKPKRSYRFANSETKTNTNSQIGTNNGFPQLNTNSHLATNKEHLSSLGDLKEKNSRISQSNTNSQIDKNREHLSPLGNHYKKYLEVTIGKQVWMSENLNVDKFRNGDPIPQAKSEEEWKNAGERKQPAWCYYENDPANGAKYGKLYNWYAVNDKRGLAPVGYHIPSKAEWRKLLDYLGPEAYNKMSSSSGWRSYRESETCFECYNWNDEYRRKVPCHACKDTRVVYVNWSGNGTNTSGFSALPGGFVKEFGSFVYDDSTIFWSSSEYDTVNGTWAWSLKFGSRNAHISTDLRAYGLSVRCLRD